MSRFKLFALFSAMMASVGHDRSLNDDEKGQKRSRLNIMSGGMLFSNSVMPTKRLNQRQLRKRWRQNPNLRKY